MEVTQFLGVSVFQSASVLQVASSFLVPLTSTISEGSTKFDINHMSIVVAGVVEPRIHAHCIRHPTT